MLQDGWIELAGDRVEEYEFRPDPDFLPTVAAIETPEQALRFVARYGLLFEAPALDVEGVPEWRIAGRLLRFRESADDYVAFASELRDVRRLYALSQRAASGDRYWLQPLRNALPEFVAERHDADLALAAFEDVFGGYQEIVEAAQEGGAADLAFLASTLVSVVVTGALESYEARFLVGIGEQAPEFALYPASPTLAGHAWLQVAAEVVQQVELADCESCDVLFVVNDPRQRYCSERCANRERSRRFRERHSPRWVNDDDNLFYHLEYDGNNYAK
jgi:hypothetical protein